MSPNSKITKIQDQCMLGWALFFPEPDHVTQQVVFQLHSTNLKTPRLLPEVRPTPGFVAIFGANTHNHIWYC